MPIIPAQRNLPNQINLVENAMAPFQATRPLLAGLSEFEEAALRVETEEAKTEAADLLSSVVIRQKEALSTDKEFDDPDLYSEHVLKEWKKARTEVEKQTKNPMTRTLLRRGIARSEASLADDFGTRISNLKEFKAQGHVVSYLNNVKKEASKLPVGDRLVRYDAAVRYLDSSRAFNSRKREELRIQLGEDMDEAAVLSRLLGDPNDPTWRDPKAALELLEINNTPFLTDKKRADLTARVETAIERAEKKGAKLSEDERTAALGDLYNMIFTQDASEEQIMRKEAEYVNARKIDVKTDPSRVRAWINQRRDGVGGSRETLLQILDDFYNYSDPVTGRPDPPTNPEKVVRYMKRAVQSDLSKDDRVTVQSRLFTIGELLKARGDAAESRSLSDYLRRRSKARQRLIDSYASFLDRDGVIGKKNKAIQRWTELSEEGDPEAAVDQALQEFPPRKSTGATGEEINVKELLEGR